MNRGRKITKPVVVIERLTKIITSVREQDLRSQREIQKETGVPALYIRLCLGMDIIRKTDRYYITYLNLYKVDSRFMEEIYTLFVSYYKRYVDRENPDLDPKDLRKDVEDAYMRAMRRCQITPKFNKTEYPLAPEEAYENKPEEKFKYSERGVTITKKPSLWTRIKNLFQ
jgi:hypothetical protein